jgi:hypothetical protein
VNPEPLSRYDAVLASFGGRRRPVGVPYPEPALGIWVVKVSESSYRRATVKEVERSLREQDARERRVNESIKGQKED